MTPRRRKTAPNTIQASSPSTPSLLVPILINVWQKRNTTYLSPPPPPPLLTVSVFLSSPSADDRLNEQRNALAVVDYKGNILWMPQAILRSSCTFNTKYFPFDVQSCWLKFGSWTYNGNKLNIEFVDKHSFDLSDYVVSGRLWIGKYRLRDGQRNKEG